MANKNKAAKAAKAGKPKKTAAKPEKVDHATDNSLSEQEHGQAWERDEAVECAEDESE